MNCWCPIERALHSGTHGQQCPHCSHSVFFFEITSPNSIFLIISSQTSIQRGMYSMDQCSVFSNCKKVFFNVENCRSMHVWSEQPGRKRCCLPTVLQRRCIIGNVSPSLSLCEPFPGCWILNFRPDRAIDGLYILGNTSNKRSLTLSLVSPKIGLLPNPTPRWPH